MVLIALLTGCLIAFLLALTWPKFASLMIWPILFLFPHNYWFQQQWLPLNIGGDDLFCLMLLLAVVARRNIAGGVRIRFGYAFWVITSFAVVAGVANVAGYAEVAQGGDLDDAIKSALKPAVYWAMFYGVLHCIDSPRDLKVQLGCFAISAALGASLVIAQNYVPYLASAFAQPRLLSGMPGFTPESRGAGAFLNPNAAACVLGCSILLAITAVRTETRLPHKTITYVLIVLMLIGMLYTRSRSGVLALVVSVTMMAALSRGRLVTSMVILGAIGVAIVFADASGLFGERLARAYIFDTGMTGRNVAGRFETWQIYLTESTTRNYLIGQGAAAGVAKFGMESHNAYISLLTVYGLGGVLWAALSLAGFLRRVRRSLRSMDPIVRATATGCLWTLVMWGVYAMTADAISSSYTRYVLFYLVVLVDRANAFSCPKGGKIHAPIAAAPVQAAPMGPGHLPVRSI